MRPGVLSMVLGGVFAGAAVLGGGCGNGSVDFGTGGAGSGGKPASSSAGGAGGATTSGSTSSSSGSTTSSSGSTTSSSGSTTSSSGSTTSSSSSSTTSASSTSSTSSTTSASSTSSTSSTAGGCPVAPQDSACVKCSKQSCCAELIPCQSDPACVCWTGCLAQNPNNPGACVGCGNYDAVTQAFVNCDSQNCLAQCTGSTSSSSSTTSTSAGGLCAPATGDSTCTACSKQKCCNEVTACAGSANCLCWVSCLTNGGTTQACFQQCGVPDAASFNLNQCATNQCGGSCP